MKERHKMPTPDFGLWARGGVAKDGVSPRPRGRWIRRRWHGGWDLLLIDQCQCYHIAILAELWCFAELACFVKWDQETQKHRRNGYRETRASRGWKFGPFPLLCSFLFRLICDYLPMSHCHVEALSIVWIRLGIYGWDCDLLGSGLVIIITSNERICMLFSSAAVCTSYEY